MKKINVFLVYFVSLIFMEFLFKFLTIEHIFRLSNINLILFLIPFSLLLSMLTNITKNPKTNRVIFIVILSILSVWFSAQYVVKSYFGCYISLGAFGVADQVVEFASKGVIETLRRLPGIICLFIPFISPTIREISNPYLYKL